MVKTGRNAPCPCGSGKKYKKCCMETDLAEERFPSVVVEDTEEIGSTEIIEDEEFEMIAEDPEIPDDAWDGENEGEDSVSHETPTVEPTEYPKPPKDDLPDLPDEQQRLVDEWWEEAKALFKGPDADGMIRHVVRFMEDRPDLFVHLGIEHEYLFELGAELGRRKQWSRYAALLGRIREEHPEMYVRGFSYYDYDLMIELIAAGQRDLIPTYFSFFHQYPDNDPDNAHRIIDLLAWTGMQDELFEFVRPIAVPMCESPDVIGGGFALRWLILSQYAPLLDSGVDAHTAANALLESVEELGLTDWWPLDPEVVRREFDICRGDRMTWTTLNTRQGAIWTVSTTMCRGTTPHSSTRFRVCRGSERISCRSGCGTTGLTGRPTESPGIRSGSTNDEWMST